MGFSNYGACAIFNRMFLLHGWSWKPHCSRLEMLGNGDKEHRQVF